MHGARCVLERYGDANSLVWVDNSPCKPDPSYKKCGVTYGGLNFKDYMLATGKIARQYLTLDFGTEFAGYIDDEESDVSVCVCGGGWGSMPGGVRGALRMGSLMWKCAFVVGGRGPCAGGRVGH